MWAILRRVDPVLADDVVLREARAGDDEAGSLAAFAVHRLTPTALAGREEVRQVPMLKIQRLVDERERRREVDGVGEVDHIHAARP